MERPALILQLEYLADILIKAEPLATGLATDVHGQVVLCDFYLNFLLWYLCVRIIILMLHWSLVKEQPKFTNKIIVSPPVYVYCVYLYWLFLLVSGCSVLWILIMQFT
jgi:hypothetical protein